MRAAPEWREDATPIRARIAQLGEYFSGTRRAFTLRLAPEGTAFQLAVWGALRAIPYGQTVSYGDAGASPRDAGGCTRGGPRQRREPAFADHRSLHRVIGADGSLTGFGGGLFIKRALLSLEGAACVADLFSAHESARRRTASRRVTDPVTGPAAPAMANRGARRTSGGSVRYQW